VTIIIIIVVILAAILAALFQTLRFLRKKERAAVEPPADEIFRLVSRVKYPAHLPPERKVSPPAAPVYEVPAPEIHLKETELIKDRGDITGSLRALAEKYSLSEITLATDDGLVLASSAQYDVQADAAKFSQIAKHQSPPDEPGVTLFEMYHKEAHIIGIIRAGDFDLPQNWKKGIREDTKVILQWWL
jgi:hypothetical protein